WQSLALERAAMALWAIENPGAVIVDTKVAGGIRVPTHPTGRETVGPNRRAVFEVGDRELGLRLVGRLVRHGCPFVAMVVAERHKPRLAPAAGVSFIMGRGRRGCRPWGPWPSFCGRGARSILC